MDQRPASGLGNTIQGLWYHTTDQPPSLLTTFGNTRIHLSESERQTPRTPSLRPLDPSPTDTRRQIRHHLRLRQTTPTATTFGEPGFMVISSWLSINGGYLHDGVRSLPGNSTSLRRQRIIPQESATLGKLVKPEFWASLAIIHCKTPWVTPYAVKTRTSTLSASHIYRLKLSGAQ